MLMLLKPTMLLREEAVRRNVRRMAEKAATAGAAFRMHCKTHQSAEIAAICAAEARFDSIAVSSVEMGEYFAQSFRGDILVAMTLSPQQMERAVSGPLSRVERLGIVVDSIAAVESLASTLAGKTTRNVDVWIKVDVGQHRTGVAAEDADAVCSLARSVASASAAAAGLRLRGLLTHAGNSYHAASREELCAIHEAAAHAMNALRERVARELRVSSVAQIELSYGDTPSLCAVPSDALRRAAWSELRPGNFVFFDAMQLVLGSCTEADIALAVACPVVSLHPERRQAVVHGGAVHLSKEVLEEPGGRRSFGLVALPEDGPCGWGASIPGARVVNLTQEHGIIEFATANDPVLSGLHIGDVLVILPVHSCLVVPLLRTFLTTTGAVVESLLSLSRPSPW